MPKDEFDLADPWELNGLAFFTPEDTTGEMAACFIEEFMRLGYRAPQILELFRNPHYLGPNLVLEKHGEPFVRDLIAEIFARWGRPRVWEEPGVRLGAEDRAASETHRVPDQVLKMERSTP